MPWDRGKKTGFLTTRRDIITRQVLPLRCPRNSIKMRNERASLGVVVTETLKMPQTSGAGVEVNHVPVVQAAEFDITEPAGNRVGITTATTVLPNPLGRHTCGAPRIEIGPNVRSDVANKCVARHESGVVIAHHQISDRAVSNRIQQLSLTDEAGGIPLCPRS